MDGITGRQAGRKAGGHELGYTERSAIMSTNSANVISVLASGR